MLKLTKILNFSVNALYIGVFRVSVQTQSGLEAARNKLIIRAVLKGFGGVKEATT